MVVFPSGALKKNRGKMDDNQQGGFFTQTVQWFAHPFNNQGSAFNWWLFVGLLVIAVWFWGRVLAKINSEV